MTTFTNKTTFSDAELDALMDEAVRAKIEHDEWVVQEGITVTNDGLLPRMTAAITHLRAAMAAKVRVKPLVWEDEPIRLDDAGLVVYRAVTPLGAFYCNEIYPRENVQADYDECVRSFLAAMTHDPD